MCQYNWVYLDRQKHQGFLTNVYLFCRTCLQRKIQIQSDTDRYAYGKMNTKENIQNTRRKYQLVV